MEQVFMRIDEYLKIHKHSVKIHTYVLIISLQETHVFAEGLLC